MKNFKSGLLAIALLAGITGAFASKIHVAPKDPEPTYDWVDENNSNPISNQTEDFARSAYECSTGLATCATGTLSPSSPVPGDETIVLHKSSK